MRRLARHWLKEAGVYDITEAYWVSLARTSGEQGPIFLMRRTPENAGMTCHTWPHWEAGGRKIDVMPDVDAAQIAGPTVVTAKWQRLGKHRSVLQGLTHGRHD